MDRIKINSKHISAGARKWLAESLYAKLQARDSLLLPSFVTGSELRGKEPSCWLSLALCTVGGGDTS